MKVFFTGDYLSVHRGQRVNSTPADTRDNAEGGPLEISRRVSDRPAQTPHPPDAVRGRSANGAENRLFGKLISGRARALAPRQRPAAFQFLRHELPKVAEQLMFARCQLPWSRVEQAKRPDAHTFLHVQGIACVNRMRGAPVTSGFSAKRASSRVSGTTST